ncbi:trichohyalin-like isoform X1 [Lethenteron reissneri]|uniref:trichohyalin-like isoform X1 n=2 Tax=Lethenteron reissneri TaxID=7753 RepID=UPI002AB5E7D3|nr:trichohyalin-like isoform X1 [Lethenteron reissneri]
MQEPGREEEDDEDEEDKEGQGWHLYRLTLQELERLKLQQASDMQEVERYVDHVRSLTEDREMGLEAENETLKQELEAMHAQMDTERKEIVEMLRRQGMEEIIGASPSEQVAFLLVERACLLRSPPSPLKSQHEVLGCSWKTPPQTSDIMTLGDKVEKYKNLYHKAEKSRQLLSDERSALTLRLQLQEQELEMLNSNSSSNGSHPHKRCHAQIEELHRQNAELARKLRSAEVSREELGERNEEVEALLAELQARERDGERHGDGEDSNSTSEDSDSSVEDGDSRREGGAPVVAREAKEEVVNVGDEREAETEVEEKSQLLQKELLGACTHRVLTHPSVLAERLSVVEGERDALNMTVRQLQMQNTQLLDKAAECERQWEERLLRGEQEAERQHGRVESLQRQLESQHEEMHGTTGHKRAGDAEQVAQVSALEKELSKLRLELQEHTLQWHHQQLQLQAELQQGHARRTMLKERVRNQEEELKELRLRLVEREDRSAVQQKPNRDSPPDQSKLQDAPDQLLSQGQEAGLRMELERALQRTDKYMRRYNAGRVCWHTRLRCARDAFLGELSARDKAVATISHDLKLAQSSASKERAWRERVVQELHVSLASVRDLTQEVADLKFSLREQTRLTQHAQHRQRHNTPIHTPLLLAFIASTCESRHGTRGGGWPAPRPAAIVSPVLIFYTPHQVLS